MFHRFTITAAMVVAFATPALAQDSTADALFEALALSEVIGIMRDEGLVYGAEVGTELFAIRPDESWNDTVAQIYDAEVMNRIVKGDFTAALAGTDVDTMLAFFTSEPGQTFVRLEVSARRALMDEAIEEAAQDRAAIAMEDETDRYLQIREFVTANDLINSNVVGAMNSNFAFFAGMLDGGAVGGTLTEDQILSDVWSQEPDIRANTTQWVYAFLMMAYQPASDADMDRHIAFSQSDAGQELNNALFKGFDTMFTEISRAMGLGAAQFMASAEL